MLVVVTVACTAIGGEPGETGSSFADVYDAFAPLAVFHRSYADHLFYGTDLSIPHALGDACDETGYSLALLHLRLATQTGSAMVATMTGLARLRADLAAFCSNHSQLLTSIAETNDPDYAQLKDASDRGVFSDIYRMQGGLQTAFEVYLDGISEEYDVWRFAVAFSLRTLLASTVLEHIDPNLRAILYGAEEATRPPAFVPEKIAVAIEELLTYVGAPLEESDLEDVRFVAQFIYEYVVQSL